MGLRGCLALVVCALRVPGTAPQVALLGAAKPRLLNGPPAPQEPPAEPAPKAGPKAAPPWQADIRASPGPAEAAATPAPAPAPPPAPKHAPSVHDRADVMWRGLGGSPLSNAVRGVTALAVLYFMVYAIVDATQALGVLGDDLAKVFKDLKDAVDPAPQLAVLFLALRVQWLHAGHEPPAVVTVSNDAACCAVLLRAVVVCLPHADVLRDHEAYFNDASVLVILATTVVAVVATYSPAGGQWPPVLPSATYASALCSTYVAVSAVEYLGRRAAPHKLSTQVLSLGRKVLSLAPMLGVLYLAAQMRVDNAPGEAAPAWMGWAMVGTAGSLAAQCLLALGAPCLIGGRLRVDEQGMATLSVDPWKGLAVQGIQCLCLAILVIAYVVLLVTLVGVPTHPPGLSATVQCVLVLASLFLAVYVGHNVAMVATRSAPAKLLALREAVEPVPMLAAVCLACRLRALSLRPDLGQGGGPPGWGIDGMYVLVLGVLLRLADHLFSRGACATRCAALVLVFGGVGTVLAAIATMNPAAATGSGSLVHALGAEYGAWIHAAGARLR